jgi:hypothetical protein
MVMAYPNKQHGCQVPNEGEGSPCHLPAVPVGGERRPQEHMHGYVQADCKGDVGNHELGHGKCVEPAATTIKQQQHEEHLFSKGTRHTSM